MAESNTLDRQAIIDRVHDHFIVQRLPAGRLSGASCIYHGFDDEERRVSCAIGIFDSDHLLDREPVANLAVSDLYEQEPGRLCDVFGQDELTMSAIGFLAGVQDEHDMAVKNAARSDADFDTYFIEELAHRLDRFAGEHSLESPCTPRDLGAA